MPSRSFLSRPRLYDEAEAYKFVETRLLPIVNANVAREARVKTVSNPSAL